MSTRTLLVALAVLALPGCLERKERVTVHRDGRVTVAHVFKGDAAEFAADAAEKLPSGRPWRIRDEVVPRANGGTDHVRTAEAELASAAELPVSAGAPDDPAPLHARTSVSIERTREGKTRWTFERRYGARARAWRQRLFERHIPEALRKQLERKEGDPPLGEDVLARAAEALVKFERDRNAALLERALTPLEGVDAFVLATARTAFVRGFDESWTPDAVLRAIRGTAAERAALESRYREETLAAASRAGAAALAERVAARDLGDRVATAFATERRVHDATEQLQLHSFEVRVELPAPVVASNAESVEDRAVIFRFGGADLCDREHVLRAVAEGP